MNAVAASKLKNVSKLVSTISPIICPLALISVNVDDPEAIKLLTCNCGAFTFTLSVISMLAPSSARNVNGSPNIKLDVMLPLTVKPFVLLSNVNAVEPDKLPASLNCTFVSEPPGAAVAVIPVSPDPSPSNDPLNDPEYELDDPFIFILDVVAVNEPTSMLFALIMSSLVSVLAEIYALLVT